MKRMAAIALAAVVLLALASPAFAGWGNDEFYPGDVPPSASPAGHGTGVGDGTSPSCQTQVCIDGRVDQPAGGDKANKAYDNPHKP